MIVTQPAPHPPLPNFFDPSVQYDYILSPFPKLSNHMKELERYRSATGEPLLLDPAYPPPTIRFTSQSSVPTVEDACGFIVGARQSAYSRTGNTDELDLKSRQTLRYSKSGNYWYEAFDEPYQALHPDNRELPDLPLLIGGSLPRYLPPDAELRDVSLEFIPKLFQGIRCLHIYSPNSIPSQTIAPGTRILAGPKHERAMVLTHLASLADLHFMLCLHGDHNIFVLEVIGNQVVEEWPQWERVAKEYDSSAYRRIFFETKTLFDRALGIYCFYVEIRTRREEELALQQQLRCREAAWSRFSIRRLLQRYICRPAGDVDEEFTVGRETPHVPGD